MSKIQIILLKERKAMRFYNLLPPWNNEIIILPTETYHGLGGWKDLSTVD